ncbi:Formamidopyrimidine-DNA glycosylase [subsurface metagenome]
MTGRTIRAVRRRGKYVLLGLDRGHVHLHLRMTGRLLVLPAGNPEASSQPHVTAEFDLSDSHRLVFRDMRKFGRVGYLDDLSPLEARLGPEPLSPQFTPRVFHRLLEGRQRHIKPLLLDQSFIAGLGNIYVDEALFLARIHPETPASRLTFARAKALHRAIRDVLSESILHDGTTIINFQYGESGRGRFREMLQVFRREGEPCPICGIPLKKLRVAQRGTYLCPACQVL